MKIKKAIANTQQKKERQSPFAKQKVTKKKGTYS